MRPLNLFLVEDSALVRRRLLAEFSAVDGVAVVGHAEGARQALAAIVGRKIDAVLLDLCLAEGSGRDVLIGLRQVGLSVIVLVMTNLGCPMVREECRRLGADYFFDKTLEWQEMIEAIQRVRDRHCGP